MHAMMHLFQMTRQFIPEIRQKTQKTKKFCRCVYTGICQRLSGIFSIQRSGPAPPAKLSKFGEGRGVIDSPAAQGLQYGGDAGATYGPRRSYARPTGLCNCPVMIGPKHVACVNDRATTSRAQDRPCRGGVQVRTTTERLQRPPRQRCPFGGRGRPQHPFPASSKGQRSYKSTPPPRNWLEAARRGKCHAENGPVHTPPSEEWDRDNFWPRTCNPPKAPEAIGNPSAAPPAAKTGASEAIVFWVAIPQDIPRPQVPKAHHPRPASQRSLRMGGWRSPGEGEPNFRQKLRPPLQSTKGRVPSGFRSRWVPQRRG